MATVFRGCALSIAAWLCSAGSVWAGDTSQPPEAKATARSALRLLLYLASETASKEIPEQLLDQIHKRMLSAEAERLLTDNMMKGPAAPDFHGLVASHGKQPFDYLQAAGESYARVMAAEKAGERDWVAKHLTAARIYAGRAVQGMRAEAKEDDEQLAQLRSGPLAVRRSTEQAKAFLNDLKTNGPNAEHRQLLLASAYQEGEFDTYVKQLLATPVEKLGMTPVELLANTATLRRDLAGWLEHFAQGGYAARAQAKATTYVVANPRDNDATIDLFIRPVAIPPGWKLSVVDAPQPMKDSAAKSKAKPKKQVEEVVPGKHYRVKLPAKGELKVASVVVPVGEVGENTTARWAVEGKIGDELIGGMVHELDVSAYVSDLALPPVVSPAAPEGAVTIAAAPTTALTPAEEPQPSWPIALAIAAGVVLVAAAMLVVYLRPRGARA